MNPAVLLDLVYPRSCAGCGRAGPSPSPHLCWDCLAEVHLIQPPFCSLCGNPVFGYIEHEYVCSNCTAHERHFDRARSAARFEGVVRDMLIQFKYRDAIWLAGDLAEVLHACTIAHFDPAEVDAVTFVPLYPARKRARGFNQAEELARRLARRLRKPLLRRCLARVRPTPTQTHLTALERATNVRHAFRAKWLRWLEGRRILLVDDVMTTGATVNECARTLKEGGAARVQVVTVARGS
ncbi:MAG: ComF family protein [Kiritimatiellae bacterium]|nr:ComF family protein [Kiritimatiellia bacterium]